MSDVKPGQIWADNDWRSPGRTLRVEDIDGDYAICTVLTNTTHAVMDQRGRRVRLLLRRFKPTSTGYRLVGGDNQ